MVRGTIRIRYEYDTITAWYDTIRYDSDNDTIRHDTIQCLVRRYDTMRIRYGYGATRYGTLARDSDGSLPPDRVREPIKFKL